MAVKLKDSSNTEIYEFPSGCEVVDEPYDNRLQTEARAYQHGAVIVGDQKLEPRIITVHGIFDVGQVNTTYGATLAANLKEMHQQCHASTVRLYPGSQYTDEYYDVKCLHFESTHLGMTEVVEVWIDFLVADPFRYYKDETSDDNTVDESPESITETNGGDETVYPVITFTAGVGSDISKVKITNDDDAGKYFEYEPASNLTSGDIVEIDCKEGTCELNSSDDMAHFSGSFIKLISGGNDITVTITGTVGTNTCNFTFRKKWR